MPVEAEVLLVTAEAEVRECAVENGRTAVAGDVRCHLLYKYGREYQTAEGSIPFRVVLEDNRLIEQTDADLKAIPGVVKTVAEYEMAQGFSTIQDVLHLVSLGIIAVLLAVSLLIISNTVKLAMYDRRDEIAIMRMVGATNGFIRFPFVVQGFVLGMVGAGLAFGLEWLMYDNLLATIGQTLKWLNFVPFSELLFVSLSNRGGISATASAIARM